ncbi:hypothetical protein EJV47_25350 [Hymenobacter gummosus]|uniref:Uncharacterized protein n=1 Tax=Hymenobacter gummosus TaxID=1776032 RepID=A0A3S0J613_9BACT|nr:hypothetical protein [Hymenobacter gummosus]RTQ45465.1 hypothetical protein EJV47_25350 [Hymenobacter gummosus]
MALRIPKLPGNRGEFRNPQICFIDAKQINLDRTLVNLYVLLKHNGGRPRSRVKSASTRTIGEPELLGLFRDMESKGLAEGVSQHPEAVKGWLRANLMDVVSRGQTDRENLASLKPIHLLSYLIRNQKFSRDYNTADQVYSFLTTRAQVSEELRSYLVEGWDLLAKRFSPRPKLDLDTLGLLRMVEQVDMDVTGDGPATFERIRPLMLPEAELYCDDVHRLLQYRHVIPRHVLLDYLKTLTGFHLSLYLLKLIRYVPQMVREGSLPEQRPLDIVVDITEDPDSPARELATDDATWFFNNLPEYVRAGHAINVALASQPISGQPLDETDLLRRAVADIQQQHSEFVATCRRQLRDIVEDRDLPEEQKQAIRDLIALEDGDVNGYLSVFMWVRGTYHLRYNTSLLDSLMQKNTENGMLAVGRSRKQKRRFVLGTRLLEMLVQLSVLRPNASQQHYATAPIAIEQFIEFLQARYGLLINGLGHPRFADADLRTHLAFSQNVQALKDKLRQIGFYTQLSDAYLLQKIRPRYTLNPA